MTTEFFVRLVKSWLPLAVGLSVVGLTAYTTIQQNYRQNANDPQIQMAEDGAKLFKLGPVPASANVIPDIKVEISTSLAPWITLVDGLNQVVKTSAELRGQEPSIPVGAVQYARDHGQNRITWQPEPGVRQAIVIIPTNYGDGTVVIAGRSLREVENRIDQLSLMMLVGWLAAMGGSLAAALILQLIPGKLH